jgi:N-acetylglucosamine kinase
MGLDGGGSKSICLVADRQGNLLGQGLGGAVNTNYVARQSAVNSIQHSIESALKYAGVREDEVECLCISAPVEPGAVAEAIRRSGIKKYIRAAEGETPRWAARFWIREHIGVTVDSGTGSLARGWSRDGRVANAGGWGATLGDEGSGYWISLQAIRAVLQAQDGRIRPTLLTQAVFAHFQVASPIDLVFRATQGLVGVEHPNQIRVVPDSGDEHVEVKEKYTGGYQFRESTCISVLTRTEIASFCPVVVQSAVQGDWMAIEILDLAGQELGKLATAVIRRLGMEQDVFAVVPFGGVFRAGKWVLDSFTNTIQSSAARTRVIQPRYEPVIGAVLLALNEVGQEINAAIIQAVDRTSLVFPDIQMSTNL